MDEIGLGKILQLARKKSGLTQQQLCQRAELSYSTLAKIERGAIKAPSIFTIQRIAGALGVSLSDLMGEIVSVDKTEKPKHQSKSGVRFIYFDINGCLVRFFHRAFTKIAEQTSHPSDVVESLFWHYNDAACRGEMSMADFNHVFAERFGLKDFDWSHYYLEAIEPIKEMQELVRWAAEYYRVGLLSNIMPGLIETMLSQGILPQLDYAAIIDSSKTGAIKPETKIYEAAQFYTDCPAQEILLVDDSRANIMAAEKLGWHVLWFDDYRPTESVARVRGALEFDS